MSGQPNPDQIKKVRMLLRRIVEFESVEHELHREIRERERKLENCTKSLAAFRNDVQTLMSEMDLISPGNMGFEGRIQVFLSEITRQAEDEVREAQRIAVPVRG